SMMESWRAWMQRPFAAGALAAVILIAVALVMTQRRAVTQQPGSGVAGNTTSTEAPSLVSPAKIRSAFVLSKAAIKVPATAVLTLRSGSEDSRTFMNDFAAALEPYRRDDFAETARRLGALVPKYPQSAEVHYYLGVARMFINQNSSALESLETARRL